MVTPSLRDLFVARGAHLLSLAGGARAFVDELTKGREVDVVVTNGEAPSAHRRYVADVLVDRQSYPELDSHRPKGEVVLPVVLALEWFARLASPLLGDAPSVRFEDVRVLRGIPLPAFDERPTRFRLVGTLEGAALRVDLEDEGGARRYSAVVRAATTIPYSAQATREPGPPDAPPFYGPGLLFSGPHLQVIDAVDGISIDRASATLRSGAETGLDSNAWQLDVAAIDGALQLAVLHTYRHGGGLQLPLRIARLTVERGAFVTGSALRADLDVRSDTPERKVCDVVIVDPSAHRTVIEVGGVELYSVPSQSS